MNLQTNPILESTSYDRADCKIGIVHLGFGAFHRAHQAVYIDDCIEQTGDANWGIAAVNLRSAESDVFHASANMENGYLLKTTSPSSQIRYQLIRPHLAFEDWAKNPVAAEALLGLESVHAVTITVTESGYYVNDDWTLNTTEPAIVAEVEGKSPSTVYGYLANALAHRVQRDGGPITIMCCDNIRGNGKMLQQNFLAYLRLRGLPDLEQWVRDNATFPCSMVDRITPRSTNLLVEEIRQMFPNRHLAPIHGESFIQWVLEDNFAGPMPDLARAGVQIVKDVDPYEEAKIRILNGGHTGLCYLGALAGHQTFDEAMRDPRIRPHFDGWEEQNVLPGLTIELPFDRVEYLREVAERFSNRAIADNLERICMDGWSKFPIFIRPSLAGCLAQGIAPTFGYDVVASWYVYARRHAKEIMHIPYIDPYWENLEPFLTPGREADFAQIQQLWADLPSTYQDFVPGIVSAIERMEEKWPA